MKAAAAAARATMISGRLKYARIKAVKVPETAVIKLPVL